MAAQLYHAKEVEELLTSFNTDLNKGLSNAEARKRLVQYGPNILIEKKQKSIGRILLDQFTSPIVWLLIAAGTLAFFLGEIPEGIAIAIVVIINTFIGFFMEWQALRSMLELKKMGRAKTKVFREGTRKELDSVQLVPGDIIYFEGGDLITADARLIVQHNLAIKEAALTGESAQVSKHTEKLPEDTVLADRTNSVFKGTLVARGNGKAIVVATGNDTELGRISEITQEAEKHATPLDKRLSKLSKKLIWLTLAMTFLIFIAGIARGGELVILLETAVALAVAAIPEGLPVIATITLARGMVRLAKDKAIVKTLKAVQTLGETNVILTDKTGTLTENDMYLETLFFKRDTVNLSTYKRNIEAERENMESDIELLLIVGTLCNDSTYHPSETESTTGDPIEIALLRSASEILGAPDDLRKKYPRIAEVPFDAEIKMMGTANKANGAYLISVKGATEAVLQKCTKMLDEDGNEVPLGDHDEWHNAVNEMAGKGLRVLSFAYKKTGSEPDHKNFIQDLTFIGLGGFIDPARKDVKEAIQSCKEAGIKVVMVTGDHPETAGSIAETVGLVKDGREATKIHGRDLGKGVGSKVTIQKHILDANIFARINASQKLDLVKLYQQNNYIVGMTGDGVNDTPALKKADIGIAMGKRGTEAAKEVADIILKDDSFSSIVLAIRQGRVIFNNIRKFVVYLLSCNLSEILVVGTASFLGVPLPLLPLQILFLNMVTDIFPALALGMNKGEWDVMKETPRRSDHPIISKPWWGSIVAYGMAMTLAVLGIELLSIYVLHFPDPLVNNMTFYTLVLVQLWNVFNLPVSSVSLFKNEITKNKYIWLAFIICIAIVVMAWLTPPLREALALRPLEFTHWIIILAFSFIPNVLIQVAKRVFKVIR
ncbi:cation-transporting ATPase [Fulvivirga imtechensis AK7]|uniref:Cation-transporting ATPase n=1 Tax=Fulvivirga imtechensis AK7 TaxID=1237149 RepID=L8JZI9_9BACT|nr:cation-transporting P-type ATPase [Fulvivirga imtechensis]ELR72612.1 cation-transporting ATPase [Fulvivirga imtechensis AK7]